MTGPVETNEACRRVAQEVATFGSAVLTGLDSGGYPFPLRVDPRPGQGAFEVAIPDGLPVQAGRASLLCHEHNERLWDLRNFVALGELRREGGGWSFRPDRFIPGDGYTPFLRFLRSGRRRAKRYLRSRGMERPRIDWSNVRQLRDRGRAGEDPNLEGRPWAGFPTEVEDVMRRFRTMELATVAGNGTPQAWPVAPFYDPDAGLLSTASSIGLSGKPLRIRRNPKVAALFSDPTASGLGPGPPVVLVQGDAVVPDEVVTPGHGFPDRMPLTVFGRQEPGIDLALRNALSRRLMDWYLMRLLIHITPRRVLWWPAADLAQAPREVPLP